MKRLLKKISDILMGGPEWTPPARFDDSTSIQPGQLVVCLTGKWATVDNWSCKRIGQPVAAPQPNCVYVVAGLARAKCGLICLELREFPGEFWVHDAFRPAKPTSIECFKHHLVPLRDEVDA